MRERDKQVDEAVDRIVGSMAGALKEVINELGIEPPEEEACGFCAAPLADDEVSSGVCNLCRC